MGQPVDFPNKTKRELKELALKAARGEIYVAWTKRQVEGSFGMFLALASDELAKQYNMDSLGYVYTTRPQDHDKYKCLNGQPIYWAASFVSKHDSPILWKEFVRLQERMDEPSWLKRSVKKTVDSLRKLWRGFEYVARPRPRKRKE